MMTTPEKLRRRQRREGLALLFLGLAMTVTTFYDSNQRNQQKDDFQDCITSVVSDLTSSLTARQNISEPRAKSFSDLINAASQATTRAEYRKALDQYNATQARLNKVLKDNPIPPFPSGTCE